MVAAFTGNFRTGSESSAHFAGEVGLKNLSDFSRHVKVSAIHDAPLACWHISIMREIIDSLSEVASFKQTNKKVNGTL